MTAWSQTVTNSLNVFGCPANYWNVFNWAAFAWGSGTADLPVQVRHLITNTLSPTEDSVGHAVRHLITNTLSPIEDSVGHAVRHLITNTLTPTEDSVGHAVRHLITNTLSLNFADSENFDSLIQNALALVSDVSTMYLTDPAGYYHVFPGGVVDSDDRIATTWATGGSTSPTWTQGTTSSTVWSAA